MDLLIENWAEREMTAYEIERGKPMPSLNHSYIQNNILVELNIRYKKQFSFFPELTLEMPERPNCVPDICIFPKMKVNLLHDKTTYSEMPLTAIEIVSPTQSIDEILLKFERYFFAGVQSCWLVQPSMQAISVYSQIGKYKFYTEDMMLTDAKTGVELYLADIFA